MKVFAIAGLMLVLGMGGGLTLLLGTGVVHAAAQPGNGITLPLVNVEVGAESATSVWAINHTTKEKWTLDEQGLRSVSLVREQKRDCGSYSQNATMLD